MKPLLSWIFRFHNRRDHAIHMIYVARQTVLARFAAGVTALADILFHGGEIGRETLRIALLIALQIRAAFFDGVAG